MAKSLDCIGNKCGLTYNEINILVYYLLIPLSWTVMLDCWLGMPIYNIRSFVHLDWNFHSNAPYLPRVVRLAVSRFS